MTQEPLIAVPAPRPAGRTWIRKAVLTSDRHIDDTAWTYHRDARQHVGGCWCGQPLHAAESDTGGPRVAYRAVCSQPDPHEVWSYGPPAPRTRRETKRPANRSS